MGEKPPEALLPSREKKSAELRSPYRGRVSVYSFSLYSFSIRSFGQYLLIRFVFICLLFSFLSLPYITFVSAILRRLQQTVGLQFPEVQIVNSKMFEKAI